MIEIRPLSIHIGAEIHGVDLTRPLAPETVQEIRAALLQWKVVFFRDQHLNHQQQTDFARQVRPAHPRARGVRQRRHLSRHLPRWPSTAWPIAISAKGR